MDVSEAWTALLIVFVFHTTAKGRSYWFTVSVWSSEVFLFTCNNF